MQDRERRIWRDRLFEGREESYKVRRERVSCPSSNILVWQPLRICGYILSPNLVWEGTFEGSGREEPRIYYSVELLEADITFTQA
jgi:hypothetical protein